MWTVQALLRCYKCVNRQDVKLPPFHFYLSAVLDDFLEVADPIYITKAVKLAEVGIEIEVPVIGAVFFCQSQLDLFIAHSMYRVEVGYRVLDTEQIFGGKFAAEVYVLRYKSAAVYYAGESAY